MRVLLGEFGGLFDAGWVREHRERIRELMRATNALRDAQVLEMDREGYRKRLPGKWHRAFKRLAAHLEREIAKERKRVEALLASEEFLEEWESLERLTVGKEREGFSEAAGLPVVFAAKKRLKLRYKRVRKAGKSLGSDGPPEAYHRMRIGVKKLRYLIEFFTPILEEAGREEMIRRLKRLQTLLGEHQDRMVQSEALERLAASESGQSGEERKLLLRLAERLRKEAAEYREAFPGHFAPVAESRELFRRMICHF
jgi:CHAD domain-containing protein